MTLEVLELFKTISGWAAIVFTCLAAICGGINKFYIPNKIAELTPAVSSSIIHNTVISRNQSGGITANQVTISKVQRALQPENKDFFLKDFKDKDEEVRIWVMANDREAYKFAEEILIFLNSNGYKNVTGIDALTIAGEPYIGIHVFRDKKPTTLIVGHSDQ